MIEIKEDSLFFEGKKIFTVPIKEYCLKIIKAAGMIKGKNPVFYAATGGCCHGHLYEIRKNFEEKEDFSLSQIMAVDFNIIDVIPVVVDWKKAGLPNKNGFLVSGEGCAGAGVRLISMYWPANTTIMNAEEYNDCYPERQATKSVFKFGDCGRIHLEFRSYESDELFKSVNLTARLEEKGYDVEKTKELIENYVRITK